MLKKFTCLLFIFLSFITTSYARFKTIDDSIFVLDFYNRDIIISSDGTSESLVEVQWSVVREQARTVASNFPIDYNSDSESIEIIEAKTVFEGSEYKVTKDMIEDKSICSNKPGFDDHKVISISFPHSEIGAKIYLKYKERVNRATMDNEFFVNYYFGTYGYWQQANNDILLAASCEVSKEV